jgi:methylmalonyl-CoA mutase
MTHVTALVADGRPYHEAGASEAQELAAMLATLVAYLRACEAAGLRPRAAFAKIGLGLAADADMFLTIAKLRAARKLVARVAEACGASHAVDKLHLAATTSERMMARRDPWVNVLRTAVACAAAAFGGADAITVLPYTWAMGQPDAFARRIARNTHLVLQEESALGRVMDPGHGAWFIETADRGPGPGGMGALPGDRGQGRHGRRARERLRPGRDGQGRRGARSRHRHGPLRADGRLSLPRNWPRTASGSSRTRRPSPSSRAAPLVAPLHPRRLAEPFERLRDAADAHLARTGKRPRVFLASLGDLAAHSARSTWVRNFLAAGGIEALAGPELHNSADAGKAFADSGAEIACICASDRVYAELAEATPAR